MSRRILGNLEFEIELRTQTSSTASSLTNQVKLPRHVVDRISAYATLLRVFLSSDADRLWTAEKVHPSCVLPAPSLARPILECEPFDDLVPAAKTTAWGMTARTAPLCGVSKHVETANTAPASNAQGDATSLEAPAAAPSVGNSSEDISKLVWNCPAAPPEVVARVQHRGFAVRLADELGIGLPGTRLIRTLAELSNHLKSGPDRISRHREWVVKAAFSTAGRDRLRGRGHALENESARRIERLLENCGELVFEPWMRRSVDFGICGVVTENRIELFSIHRQIVSPRGQLQAIELVATRDTEAASEEERSTLRESAATVGHRLHDAGYRGPFGIDAWRYHTDDGCTRLMPLGEINARLTFGCVARAFAQKYAPDGVDSVRLAFGKEVGAPVSRRVIPLLAPKKTCAAAAWLEICRAGR